MCLIIDIEKNYFPSENKIKIKKFVLVVTHKYDIAKNVVFFILNFHSIFA